NRAVASPAMPPPSTTAGGASGARLDSTTGTYAISSGMSSTQRRYLLIEQGVGAAVFNFFVNAVIAWAMFRAHPTVPLWGQQSIMGDTIGTCFILPFLTCLIVTRLARGHVRTGKVPPLQPT